MRPFPSWLDNSLLIGLSLTEEKDTSLIIKRI